MATTVQRNVNVTVQIPGNAMACLENVRAYQDGKVPSATYHAAKVLGETTAANHVNAFTDHVIQSQASVYVIKAGKACHVISPAVAVVPHVLCVTMVTVMSSRVSVCVMMGILVVLVSKCVQ